MPLEFTQTTPVTIDPGRPNTVRSTLEVSGVQGTLLDVDVLIDITHSYTGDLDITLIGPGGQRVTLVRREGGSGNNFANTVFDDEASSAVESESAPFQGRFRPEGDLSRFDENAANGKWTLEIDDRAFADGGSLNRWGLIFDIETPNRGPFVFENRTPRIVDSGAPNLVRSNIAVTGLETTNVGSLEVTVDLDHTYTQDLTLTLVGPDNTRVVLAEREGGSANNFRNTQFSATAETSITDGSAPFEGRFRPEGDLSVFEGTPANGFWQLEIVDAAWADGGTLKHWSLSIVAAEKLPPKPSEFKIEVRFLGGLSDSQRAVFEEAAARWSDVIIGDLVGVNTEIGFIDDVVIDAEGTSIDGPGSILGQAGPTALRPGSLLPARGIMSFDSADLAQMEQNGSLFDVIVHEMGHVLGFGTLWNRLGLIQGSGTSDPVFVGANAMREYGLLIGSPVPIAVPVANTGGPGTRDGHWRESTFANELMTGFVDVGSNPVSRLTIAAFQDMGYQVSFDSSDSYQLPGTSALAIFMEASRRLRCCECAVPEAVVLPETSLVTEEQSDLEMA